jgi:hypothetical protein
MGTGVCIQPGLTYYMGSLVQDLGMKVGRLTFGSRTGTSGSYAKKLIIMYYIIDL